MTSTGVFDNRMVFRVRGVQEVRNQVGRDSVVGMGACPATSGRRVAWTATTALRSRPRAGRDSGLIDYMSIVVGGGRPRASLPILIPGFLSPAGGGLDVVRRASRVGFESHFPLRVASRQTRVDGSARHRLGGGRHVGMVHALTSPIPHHGQGAAWRGGSRLPNGGRAVASARDGRDLLHPQPVDGRETCFLTRSPRPTRGARSSS